MNKDNKKSVRTFSPMYPSSPFEGSNSPLAKKVLAMRKKYGNKVVNLLKYRNK